MSSSSCYYPNGNPSQENDIPCSSGDGVQCCPQGWTCQDNGLCYLENQQFYGRYTCTDQSWQSSGCPHICTYDNTAAGNEAVLDCGNGFCCDTNRPDDSGGASKGCCATSTDRFQLSNRQMVNNSSPSLTQSLTTTSFTSTQNPITTDDSGPDGGGTSDSDDDEISTTFSQTSSHTSSRTPSHDPSHTSNAPSRTSIVVITSVVSKSGRGPSTFLSSKTDVIAEPASTSSPTASKHNNIGAIVGPAVAVPLVVISLAALFFFLWRRRKQRQSSYDRNNHAGYEPKDPVDMYAAHKPKLPELESPDPQKTPSGTAPPSYRGVSSVTNTPNLGNNPTSPGSVSKFRNSGPPPTSAFPPEDSPPAAQGSAVTELSELPGSTYHPYRPSSNTGP